MAVWITAVQMRKSKPGFSLSCNIWTWLLSERLSSADLRKIYDTFLELISVLSICFHQKLLSFLPAPYFHSLYHKTGTITSVFACVCSCSLFSSFPYFHILSRHSTLLPRPHCLFNYHFSSLFNLFMLRNSSLYPALNCQLPWIQPS